jgi:CelD/BcsL family acetyltransferase involved in cellulose biosynthesis
MNLPAIAFYPTLPPGAFLRRPAHALPYPLGREDCSLFSRGRHAIWQALRVLGIGPGDRVLAPAWHHGAEIEALHRAGADLSFYEPGEDLQPDAGALDSLIDARTRALFLTHYLGFPQDGARWRRWCDERGLLLIEDAAHACLARDGCAPVGSHGHAAMWCLFKSFALPDGAALRLARGPMPEPDRAPVSGAVEVARSHAYWLLGHAHAIAALAGGQSQNGHFDLTAEIQLGEPGTPPSVATTYLLPRVADEHAAARRRANYAVLLDSLRDQVPQPFAELPDGAAPLGLPLRSSNKRLALQRLGERGIDAVDFWSAAHPLLPAGRFGATTGRRESTVLLPVHQELRPVDLERMLDAARLRPASQPPLRIARASSVAELYEEWSELALRARNLFATPEWAAVWCAHFLRGRRLELVTLRGSAGRLVAVVPLYVLSERPLRVLRVVGHGPGEDLGPVCDPGDRVRVGRALPRVLAELGAHALLADHVSCDAGWSALAGARRLRAEPSPAIRFDGGDWEAFVATRSRRLRKELGRNERMLARDHGLRCSPDGEFDTFVTLHEARWREGGSRFSAHLPFHRDFATMAGDRGWLRVWTLEADGRPVAAAYGFRYAGVEFDYQGGRDPDWQGPSAGLVLQGRQIRAALEDGMSEYRLCRGGTWYKQRFATHHPDLETLMVSRGPAASAVSAAGAALPEPISNLVKRRLAT